MVKSLLYSKLNYPETTLFLYLKICKYILNLQFSATAIAFLNYTYKLIKSKFHKVSFLNLLFKKLSSLKVSKKLREKRLYQSFQRITFLH